VEQGASRDNSARPSGALVASGGGALSPDQFERLKQELADNFQGARNAGRPLLLEGGLDWRAMSLSPRDLDFIESKHAAAREIALALGVPPMLLAIPGDNTYSNYQEASRGFWRQTVLPLVARTARALAGWLGPAWDERLSLRPDLDAVPALAPEREALWARVDKASFLTRAEKRQAVGYGAESNDASDPTGPEAGADATGPFDGKFNPYHDALGRFTSAPGGGEGSDAGGGDDDAAREGGDETDDGEEDDRDARVIQVSRRRGGPTGTPAEEARLTAAISATRSAERQVRELDPNWQPPQSVSATIQGRIADQQARAEAARARIAELLPRGFGSYESYASFGQTLREGLSAAGFQNVVPMLRGSAVTGQSFRTGEQFDAGRRSDYDIALVSPQMLQRATEVGIALRQGQSRTGPLNSGELEALGLSGLRQVLEHRTQREANFMIYGSMDTVTIRGPSLRIPAR
jgi:hypothetical protein